MLEALQEPTLAVEDVNKAEALAANWIMFWGILHGVRNVNVGADALDVERGEAVGDRIVVKGESCVALLAVGFFSGEMHLFKCGIKNVHMSAAEIRGQD